MQGLRETLIGAPAPQEPSAAEHGPFRLISKSHHKCAGTKNLSAPRNTLLTTLPIYHAGGAVVA